ncbi:response regulator transcription factor [Rhodoferax sp. BLA1]|uniref:response regulator n=1 Tax=Rhodoferax sp. BLA1 TaxID=2576062 RepID=UPI0015D3E204|nr:response regulator transcription factor [Rhodoferax sp. BLA1]
MIRILITDDHAIVRSGLKQIFQQVPDFEVVGEASNGSELVERLSRSVPDVLLMDLDMPGISGSELITRIRASWPGLPLLVLSMHNEPSVAVRALKAGASGYITKDCDLNILLPAIRTVAAGQKYILPGMAEQMVFEDTPAAQHAPHFSLTDREMQVFNLLVAGSSVNDIASQLCVSNKTISTHKAKMMEKLNISSVAELVRYALQHGLVN